MFICKERCRRCTAIFNMVEGEEEVVEVEVEEEEEVKEEGADDDDDDDADGFGGDDDINLIPSLSPFFCSLSSPLSFPSSPRFRDCAKSPQETISGGLSEPSDSTGPSPCPGASPCGHDVVIVIVILICFIVVGVVMSPAYSGEPRPASVLIERT